MSIPTEVINFRGEQITFTNILQFDTFISLMKHKNISLINDTILLTMLSLSKC